MLQVTRKRIAQVMTPDDLRAIMNGDLERAITIMPHFISDSINYAGAEAGRAALGQMVLRDFAHAVERFKNDLAVTPSEVQMLTSAVKKGTRTAPGWIRTLDAARAWGIRPWELAEDNQKQFWLRRFSIVESIKAKAN